MDIIKQQLEKYNYHKLTNIETKEKGKDINIPSEILTTLVGSGIKNRKGAYPSSEIIETITNNINSKTSTNKPITISLAFGCAKATQIYNDKGIDLAEFLALENLIRVRNEIKEVYRPGVKFNISLHDSWWEYIYSDGVQKVRNYCSGIEDLLLVLDQDYINLTKLSDVTKSLNNVEEITKTANDFSEIFKKYWFESEGVPESKRTNLKSYTDLLAIGWKGTIPQIMRDHYLHKIDKRFPNSEYEEKVENLCRYFAFGRTIDTYDLSKRNTSDVDLSYISLPPGIPKNYMKNRLFVRPTPPGITKKQIPPWASSGIIEMPSGIPKIVTDYDRVQYKFSDRYIYNVQNNKKNFQLHLKKYLIVK